MHGYLAYVAGKPVGWCHAAPRRDIPNLQASEELRVDDVNFDFLQCLEFLARKLKELNFSAGVWRIS